MKLWKCAAIIFMLCAAALSLFFTRAMVPKRIQRLSSSGTSSSQSMLSTSSDSSSSLMGRHHRSRRAADSFGTLLEEFTHMFESFTEGELKQVIDKMIERKAMKDVLEARQSKRTKRARKSLRACSLRHVDVTVSDLGLGYQSDETLRFKYCSGGCSTHRRNYDITLEYMKNAGFLKADKSGKPRDKPCCRPTAYDKDISFLDNNNRYHTIHNVSARQCGCV
ncbi:neurturin [Scleropages formosus]|nr:neurturin [Scleropages formosus]